MSRVVLPTPGIGVPGGDEPSPVFYRFEGDRSYDLWVFDVGLACCAVEFVAATMSSTALSPSSAPAASPESIEDRGRLDVMVVSGTVTDKMAPEILALYERLPGPVLVVSFGSCANSGGPYWDSYSVTKGVDQLIPVDAYVPGCPPRPESLLHALQALEARIAAGLPEPSR